MTIDFVIIEMEDPNQTTEKEEKLAWEYLRMFTKMELFSTIFPATTRNQSFANNKQQSLKRISTKSVIIVADLNRSSFLSDMLKI